MNKRVLTVIISLCISLTFLSACTTTNQPAPDSKKEEQTFAADTLLAKDGTFGNNSDGILRVGFIGGSLTDAESYTSEEGYAFDGKPWTNTICQYLEDKFPNRQVIPHNAGIGGTCSDYGAARISNTILDYAPDIVFIEYTVNDSGYSERADAQKNMEAMVRMTQQLDKIPVVIFLYTPLAVENDSDQYQTWERGKNWKQEIADYYGIGSIDIYDYMQKQYAKTDYPTFLDFIAAENQYRGSIETEFDVHGGYGYYANAIIDAFDNNPSEYIKRPEVKEDWFENNLYKDSTYMSYNLIFPESERLQYNGDWQIYNYDDLIVVAPYDLQANFHSEYTGLAPQKHKHGVMTTIDTSASFSIVTKADALYISSLVGTSYYHPEKVLHASVYVDGEYIKELTYDSFKLISELDGQEHNVTVKMSEPSSDESWFLMAYITEAFLESNPNK